MGHQPQRALRTLAGGLWLNECPLCRTTNPSAPKQTPPTCAGCGNKLEPFRDTGEGWGTWQNEERRIFTFLDKRAVKARQRAERQRRREAMDEQVRRRLARRLAQ